MDSLFIVDEKVQKPVLLELLFPVYCVASESAAEIGMERLHISFPKFDEPACNVGLKFEPTSSLNKILIGISSNRDIYDAESSKNVLPSYERDRFCERLTFCARDYSYADRKVEKYGMLSGSKNVIRLDIGKLFDNINVTMMDKTDTAELERIVLQCMNRALAIATSSDR